MKVRAKREKGCTEKLERVVVITKKHSNKVELLNKNNKCCVEIHTEDDSICLQGTVEIRESEKDKTDILPEAYIKRLMHSGSEKYCVLIFNTSRAYLYIDEESKVLYF